MKPGRAARLCFLLLCLCCAGCTGWQSAMDPQGPAARRLDQLFWLFTGTAALIWLLVMLVLALALLRRRMPPEAVAEHRSTVAVGGAVAATVLIITGLTFASYLATRQDSAGHADALVIRVRGFQWWWEVTYPDAAPDHSFLTANEIHIPVGRPVRIELAAADVIHSFWVPNLAGKQDMIPGRDNALTFTVQQPGIYRGQCAEFCGLQHAHMALLVVAEPPEAFERWRAAQLAEAQAPRTPEAAEGQRLLETKACVACHTVRGTAAAGTLGPDLTHLASRQYLAAGMLPVTRGALAAWIADPQTIKPGNNMPMVSLSADELQALSAYLVDLK
jgi:cytochrome c oxidase subunit 2